MPTRSHSALLPEVKHLSKLGRGLAALQLVKETLTVLLLGLPLLLQQPVLAPAALPGLVLYLYRWGMVLGQVPRRAARVVWLLTLLDEVWGLLIYNSVVDEPTARQLRYLTWSYALGLAFTLAALAEIYLGRRRERRHLRALLRAA
ncbi:MAG: hypothetical protein ACRYFK_01325 [Janthinobacterium lividum]